MAALRADRHEHLLPDNPIELLPSGAVVHTDKADLLPHFRQLRDYWRALRPEGRRGRPPKEEALARVVDAKIRDGKHWKEIVREEGLRDKNGRQYDLYDQKDAKRAYSHVRRLVERGKLLARLRHSAQERP